MVNNRYLRGFRRCVDCKIWIEPSNPAIHLCPVCHMTLRRATKGTRKEKEKQRIE